MYISIYICIFIYIYIGCIQTLVSHPTIYTQNMMCIYIYSSNYLYTFLHISYIHTYIHTCMHACMHAYIHTYITLHYITLHYITLHTFHSIPFHSIPFHHPFITLHYITLHYITLHYYIYVTSPHCCQGKPLQCWSSGNKLGSSSACRFEFSTELLGWNSNKKYTSKRPQTAWG